ncbi:MAG: insulinase family protein, partial [Planctomycetes bacterium]|nr:insulinase family protein [Planctomycetota bacterium]
NYFSQGPASLLPTLLWLDAERLEDLGRAMDQAKVDRQCEVVRNEIRQNVENRPYGAADEAISRLMYPPEHPYHKGVYGTHEDLAAATARDVREFFATFYAPNNASLVIAGDFDPAVVKPLVAELLGTLPAGAPVVRKPEVRATLDRPVRTTMLDKVQQPLVKMVWHSPPSFAEGDAELSLCAAVLTSGKDSRLYKRMVIDEKQALDVSAFQRGAGLGSLFQIDVTPAPGADLDAIERTVDEELARLCRDGVGAAELEQRQAGYELRTLSSLQNLAAVADRLNQYEYVWGEPNSFRRDLDRYRKATPAGVQAWAKQVFAQPGRAVIRVLPAEAPRPANARDQRPQDLPMPAFTVQLPEQFTLENGIPVALWRKPELPLVSVLVQFQTGAPLGDPATAGLIPLTAEMLGEGAGERDALAFSAAMQSLGARLHTGADLETATASCTSLKRNLPAVTALLADAVRRPRLQPADWERVQRVHLEGLRQQDEEPGAVSGRAAMRALFGPQNPYGVPADGLPETVEPLSLEQVKQAHAALFAPEHAVILLAGDLTADEARAVLGKAFGDWKKSGRARPAPAGTLAATPGAALRVVIVDRPDAVQTVIRFVAPAPAYRDPQRMPRQLLNSLLGGSFTSRLNQNLREQHGFTYGASSGYAASPFCGWFSAGASVQAKVTGEALKQFLLEFDRLRKPGGGDVTDVEADKARATLRTQWIQSFEGLRGVLGAASELVLNGLPYDQVAKDLQAIGTIRAADLNALATSALPIDQGVLVLVGDKQVVLEQLRGLPLPAPTFADPRGRPLPQ